MAQLKVKELLKSKGLTAKELAGRLGVTDIALRASLKGNPTIGTLERVADALGVSVAELFEPQPSNAVRCPHCGGVLHIDK